MTKKKKKSTKEIPQDDIDKLLEEDKCKSEIPSSSTCPHVLKSIRTVRLLSKIATVKKLDCKECQRFKDQLKSASKLPENYQEPSSFWFCCYCFMIHCGRYDKEHAQEHYTANQTHCIVLQLETLEVWCYACNFIVNLYKDLTYHILGDDEIKNSALVSELNIKIQGILQKNVKNLQSKSLKVVPTPLLKNSSCTPGLVNLGNTCFFNSVLQCLIHTPKLVECISKNGMKWTDLGLQESNFPLTFALGEAILSVNGQIQSGSTRTYNPKELFHVISSKWRIYSSFRQQDSHELLVRLFDGIQVEFHKNKQEMDLISHLFGGKLSSILVCDACKNTSIQQEDYLIVSLSIPLEKDSSGLVNQLESMSLEKDQELNPLLEPISLLNSNNTTKDTRNKSVQECLKQFLDIEILDGKNERECEACSTLHGSQESQEVQGDATTEEEKKTSTKEKIKVKSRQKAYKRYLIQDSPPILILHLNRFEQTGPNGKTSKVQEYIDFEQELNLKPFMTPSKESTRGDLIYKLIGVVVHSGGMMGGHYIAYVLQENEWIYCSDSHTRLSNWDQVKQAQAYLLFYEKV